MLLKALRQMGKKRRQIIGLHIRGENPQVNESHTLIGLFPRKGYVVGLKQPRGDGERCVTPDGCEGD